MSQQLGPSPGIFTSFIRWLKLKNYQYEVTVALYMLTPTEKFVFNTLLLLITSMLLIAAYVYLPDHITTICQRIWYYWAGDAFSSDFSFLSMASSASSSTAAGKGGEAVMETVQKVAETAATAATTAAEAVGRGEL
ncbi:hypothetical protein FQN50_006862 [Emmonsiellopsis sp. PD_5]|nr:hypothetical protein FQN50_006862 [Emmonsiellopsis sp. PD_5]